MLNDLFDTVSTFFGRVTKAVAGERSKYYGHPVDNHSRTARFWSDYLDTHVSPEDVCWLNILQKVSREMHSPSDDNIIDVAGYAANIHAIRERYRAETVDIFDRLDVPHAPSCECEAHNITVTFDE